MGGLFVLVHLNLGNTMVHSGKGLAGNGILLTALAVIFVLSLAYLAYKYIYRRISSKLNNISKEERAENVRMRGTLKSIGNGLLATDIKGIVTFMNPTAEAITGYSKQDAMGKPLENIFKPANGNDAATDLNIRKLVKSMNTDVIPIKTAIITKNNEKKFVSGSITGITNDFNEFIGVVVVFEDTAKATGKESKFKDTFGKLAYKNADTEIAAVQDISLQYSGTNELKQQQYDTLTSLPNRNLFYEHLNQALKDAVYKNTCAAVLFLDLDMFKNINDTLGHNVGDLVLKHAAGRLMESIGKDSTIARMGGDEFAILITGIKGQEDAAKAASKILEAFSGSFVIENHELTVSASIGIAVFPEHGGETHEILKNAASAMHKVKLIGRNDYQIYSPDLAENSLEKFRLINNLRHAIDNEELLLHYQPKVDGKTGELVGMEALVRWQHPEKGLIYPSEFIPLAEETGIIKALDEWVLRRACNQLKQWRELGHTSLRLAVNLSAWQFKEKHLPDIVANVLKETGIDASFLELEITETAAMENLDFTINALSKLMDMGVNISIDDFGTGYSSLNYLKRFPINFLKIDQTFIADILEDKNTYAIVKAIIDVAHTLSLKVIAEGVETKEQLRLLQHMGCDEIQGFYISKPLPADEAEKHIEING
ncbi:MAG: EAL domain-containing protein [Caulobacteraceae bacterium]